VRLWKRAEQRVPVRRIGERLAMERDEQRERRHAYDPRKPAISPITARLRTRRRHASHPRVEESAVGREELIARTLYASDRADRVTAAARDV
jgi:hypothetical protein